MGEGIRAKKIRAMDQGRGDNRIGSLFEATEGADAGKRVPIERKPGQQFIIPGLFEIKPRRKNERRQRDEAGDKSSGFVHSIREGRRGK